MRFYVILKKKRGSRLSPLILRLATQDNFQDVHRYQLKIVEHFVSINSTISRHDDVFATLVCPNCMLKARYCPDCRLKALCSLIYLWEALFSRNCSLTIHGRKSEGLKVTYFCQLSAYGCLDYKLLFRFQISVAFSSLSAECRSNGCRYGSQALPDHTYEP